MVKAITLAVAPVITFAPVSAVAVVVAAVDAPPVAVAFVDVGASVAATESSRVVAARMFLRRPGESFVAACAPSACSQLNPRLPPPQSLRLNPPSQTTPSSQSSARNLSMQSPPPPLNSLTAAHKSPPTTLKTTCYPNIASAEIVGGAFATPAPFASSPIQVGK
ncbi:hypothetical protein HJC23_005784 [Cyclotella cryptica]|uniref:Secreted protein n=1 Tax=Cyclotella cryptica TaxID=29204 RepID=A0ABD3PAF9_9STRA